MGNFIYEDDYQRIYYGYAGWTANGRPLADLIFSLISPGFGILDIYPMGQILNIFVVAYIAYLFNKKYYLGIVTSSLVAISLICHPFYLENLAYRFDSLTMAMAIFFSACPFIVKIESIVLKFLFSTLCVFAALSIYQISINVFLCFFSMHIIISENKYSLIELIKKILFYASATIFGGVTYLMSSKFFVSGTYSKNLSQPIDLSSGILTSLMKNISRVSNMNDSITSGSGFNIYVMPFIIIFFISLLSLVIKNRRNASSLFSITISASIIALVYKGGILLLLNHPVVFPRTGMGLGGVLAFMVVVVSISIPKKKIFLLPYKTSLALMLFYFSTISYTYANSLHQQQLMQKRITDELTEIIDYKHINDLYVSGLQNTRNKNIFNFYSNRVGDKLPVLKWLTPTYFGRWGWLLDTNLRMNGYEVYRGNESSSDRPLLKDKSNCSKTRHFNYCIENDIMFLDF